MDFLLKKIEQILRYQRKWKKWQKVVASLACIVVFITTYALILPAITMDRDEAQSQGGISWEGMQEEEETVASADAQGADQDGILSAEEANLIAGSELDVSEEQAEMDVVGEENSAGEGTLNPEAASERPAAIFDEVAGDVTVHVEAPEGAFPVGTTMKVEPVADEQVMDAVQSAVEDPVTKVSAVDIIFLDASGNEIEPAAEIKVSMSSTVMENVEQPVIVHVDEEGVGETVESEQVDGAVVFESDRFSVYVIVGTSLETEITLPGSDDTYEVSVTYGPEAKIPDGATLDVKAFDVDSEEYKEAKEAVVAAKKDADAEFDEKDLGFAALDITIIDAQGNPVEPAEGTEVKVFIQMKKLPEGTDEDTLNNSLEVLHFNESSGKTFIETVAEAKDVLVENGTAKAEFTTDSFSTFSLTWNDGSATIHWGTTENGAFNDFDTTKLVLLDTTEPTVSLNIAHEGYAFSDANVKYPDDSNKRITPYLYKTNNGWEMDSYVYDEATDTHKLERVPVPNGGDIYVTYVEPASPNPHTPADSSKIPKPTTNKDVVVNTDGTATITLDITGKTVTETDIVGANVLIVLDNTSSMNFRMGNTRRWPAAKSAINTLVNILTTGENANNDIEFALIDFHCESGGYPRRRWNVNRLHSWRPRTGQHQNSGTNYWTSNATQFNSYIQNDSYDWDEDTDGTNWESPLTDALTILNARDEDPTYVLFVTDGEPNCAGTSTVYTYYDGDVVTPATTAARQIAGIQGVSLYGIFVGNDNGYSTLNDVITNAGGVSTINGTDSTALNNAFSDIAYTIIENLGATNVSIDDGVTDLSSVSAQVPSGITGGYEYYYKTEGSDNWIKWTDAPGATYTEENGVTWDLSSTGTLPAGTTYRVKFNVWPSQEALDLIANLNNGTVDIDDLDDDVKSQISGNKTDGYTLATNTHLNTTYSFKGNTYTDPITPLPSGDMPLISEQMKVKKKYVDSINPTSRFTEIDFYLLEDGKYYQKDGTTSTTFDESKVYVMPVTAATSWENKVYIAPGFIETTSNGFEVLETGHKYSLEEKVVAGGDDFEYEYTPQTVRPMIIDGTLTYLVLKDKYYTNPDGATEYQIKDTMSDKMETYYVLSTGSHGTLTGTNRKTAELDISKIIHVDGITMTDEGLDAETFTYRVTLSVPSTGNPSGITAHEYIETEGGYTLYGYRDQDTDKAYTDSYNNIHGKTFRPADSHIRDRFVNYNESDKTWTWKSGLDSFTEDGVTYYRTTFDLTLNRDEVLRLTNLPSGTKYTIQEIYANKLGTSAVGDECATEVITDNSNLSSEGYAVTTVNSTGVDHGYASLSSDKTTVTGTISDLDVRYYNEFHNTISKVVDVNLAGTKKLDGYDWSGESYHFTLAARNSAYPMPPATTGKTEFDLTAASGNADQTDTFGRLRFSSAGTYTYTVSETNAGTLQVVNGKAVQFGNAVTVAIVIAEDANTHELSVESVTGTGVTWDADTKTATATITNTAPTTTASAKKAWLNADNTTTAPANAKVTFTLYKDGVITNPAQTVELDGTVDENGEAATWEATFSGLQKYKVENGQPVEIAYTIFEEDSGKWTGYDRVNTEPVASGGTITNKQSTLWVRFKKTDMDGDRDGHRLAGAIFTFNDGVKTSDITVTSGSDGIMATTATATEASVNKFQLAVRTDPYVLTETNAPDGYNKLTGVVNVTVGTNGVSAKLGDTVTQYTVTGTGTEEDPYVVIITNSSGEELPMTGGPGTLPYTLGGIVLMLGAALMYGFRMRRRERRLN